MRRLVAKGAFRLSARKLLYAAVMENHNLPSEYVHPIQTAISDLYGLARTWLKEVSSPDVAKIRRAIARASDHLEIAADGSRRVHHLNVARECLLLTRSCFKRLFLDAHVSSSIVDEARRRVAQALACIAQLRAVVGDRTWSTVELPAIEAPPVNLDEEPTLKSLYVQIARIAAVVKEVREREEGVKDNRSPPVRDAA
jgi:hypothetical protein